MYAILDIGGRQEKVEKGMEFDINRLDKKAGTVTKFPHVLMAKRGHEYIVGRPYIKGATVECEVISHLRGEKVVAFKFKRRRNYRRKIGHRQDLTRLKVKEIHV